MADPAADVTLLSVTSNEPDNGEGDGNTINDIVIVDPTKFQLRAERSGIGIGRTYTIQYQAVDYCGNVSVSTATLPCRSIHSLTIATVYIRENTRPVLKPGAKSDGLRLSQHETITPAREFHQRGTAKVFPFFSAQGHQRDPQRLHISLTIDQYIRETT